MVFLDLDNSVFLDFGLVWFFSGFGMIDINYQSTSNTNVIRQRLLRNRQNPLFLDYGKYLVSVKQRWKRLGNIRLEYRTRNKRISNKEQGMKNEEGFLGQRPN